MKLNPGHLIGGICSMMLLACGNPSDPVQHPPTASILFVDFTGEAKTAKGSGGNSATLPEEGAELLHTGLRSGVTGRGTCQITAEWTECDDDDFSKYELFRSEEPNIQGDPYAATLIQVFTSSSQLTYVDNNLTWEKQYYYAIRTTDSSDLTTWSNEASETTPAKSPEPTPSVLSVEFTGSTRNDRSADTSVSILERIGGIHPDRGTCQTTANWTPCPDMDFKSYTLYRSLEPEISEDTSAAVNLGVFTAPDDTLFTDTTVIWETTYYYALLSQNEGGYSAWSNECQLTMPEEINLIVTTPNSSTIWTHEQTGTTVSWSGGAAGSVRIEIWQNGSEVGDYSDWVPNTGSYTRSDPLSSSWSPGSGYSIKVIDQESTAAMSESFLIEGTIEVTEPTSSTVWSVGDTNTQVVWNGGGAEVMLEVWYAGEYVDDYSGWIPNTGNYTRAAPVSSQWGIGPDFRIRVVESGSTPDDGYSEEFQIFDDLDVTEPNASSVWAWGRDGITVTWSEPYSDSVAIVVFESGSPVGTFATSVPNTGSYTRTDPIPSSWGWGEDFQIKVAGDLGSYGYSELFVIWAMDIFEPSAATEWMWNQTDTQVLWSAPVGSEVRMEVWQDGSKVDDYCSWTPNDGSYIRSATIPGSWGEGNNYRIRMIDDLANEGWSEEFLIINCLPDTLPEGMEFVTIPPGSFEMGAPDGEVGSSSAERPVHLVTFSYSFEMMTTEVTQSMWEEVMGYNPSSGFGVGSSYPVYSISWNDCQDFVSAINFIDPDHEYRLPSEAEWEYCCRAGTTERFYWGDDPSYSQIGQYVWYNGNSGGRTQPVGQKIENAWGLYDMSGNVWEWCEDWYHDSYWGAPTDGSPWLEPAGSYRVIRGGSWDNLPQFCRSAFRNYYDPIDISTRLGFRIVRLDR